VVRAHTHKFINFSSEEEEAAAAAKLCAALHISWGVQRLHF